MKLLQALYKCYDLFIDFSDNIDKRNKDMQEFMK